mmetsp:Transcript_86663/g.280588  ORF Transcript_86663/g.280588 Transcript_86663/m.280588 type:complete len:207 (+) Transcript_86663:972-1592(+)
MRLVEAIGHGPDVLRRDQLVPERLLDARALPEELHTLLDEVPVVLAGKPVVVRMLRDQELRPLIGDDGCTPGLVRLQRKLSEADAPLQEAHRRHGPVGAGASLNRVHSIGARRLCVRSLHRDTSREDDVELVADRAHLYDNLPRAKDLERHGLAEASLLELRKLEEEWHVLDNLQDVADMLLRPHLRRNLACLPDYVQPRHPGVRP